jgi:hypothetical protein
MPAVATIEQLTMVRDELAALKQKYPDAFQQIQGILRKHRVVGFKNISKLLLEETTPEKLKGLD